MKDDKYILESQVREIYGRVIYTHKTHEKCAEILNKKSNILKVVEIVLSAFSTTSILVVMFGEGIVFEIIAAVCSTLLLGITLYFKDFNLLGLAERHKQTALNILVVREKILSLLIDIRIDNGRIKELLQVRDKLNDQLSIINKKAPPTTSKGYILASIALKRNEEFTFSDDEIDKFLPECLRRCCK